MDDSKTVERAEREISKLNLPIPNQPAAEADSVEWPINVGDLSPDDLAEHMSWWSGWSGFARWHLARAETNATAYREEYDKQKSERIFRSKNDYSSVTELKASVEQAPDMQRVKIKILEAEAVQRMLKSLLAGYEDKYATISREISRRGMDWDESSDRYKA